MSETELENPDAEPDEVIEGGDDQEAEPDDGGDLEAKADTGPSTEAIMEKADKENRRYMKALTKILGPDDSRRECVHCNGLGVQWGDDAPSLEVATAEDAEACPHCNALGVVKTGSLQPGQETKPCAKCGGRGWREVVAPLAAVTPYVAAQPEAPQVLQGQYIPGKGFVPYGQTEPIAGSLEGA